MYTKEQAAERLKEWLLDNLPRQYLKRNWATVQQDIDQKWEYFHTGFEMVYLEYEIGYCTCTLRLTMDHSADVTWSSDSHNPQAALAAFAMHRQVSEFAAAWECKRLYELGWVKESEAVIRRQQERQKKKSAPVSAPESDEIDLSVEPGIEGTL